ncbi:MAG TPA: hypothetical protein VJ846_11160 [Sphingomicrobium sp.]|nr:hypothetical protein [Sphingomicrobium sp.]
MKEPRREKIEEPRRSINWTAIACLVILLPAIAIFFFARGGNSDQDKLTNAKVATSSPPPRHDNLCASTAAFDWIKRELFRRAAKLRGSDQATFERLSNVAAVRMENPALENEDSSTGAVNCSGSLSLDLPPGVVATGGRRTLMGDVDYTVTAGAETRGPTVLLRNADAIVNSLATLTEAPQPVEQTMALPGSNEMEAAPGSPTTPPQGKAQPNVPPAPARTGTSGRGFNCSPPQSPGEISMCKDPFLMALDREMAVQYSQALAVASPDQRALLRDTARRFYNYRDRCSTSSCVSNAYAGRMREIRDIIEDRWQPVR